MCSAIAVFKKTTVAKGRHGLPRYTPICPCDPVSLPRAAENKIDIAFDIAILEILPALRRIQRVLIAQETYVSENSLVRRYT